MTMIYGCLSVEGPSWTHPDCLAMQLANTVFNFYKKIKKKLFLVNWTI